MNTFEESMVVEEEVSISSHQKLNSSKKWLDENDMKKIDRKTWEKTGARPKSNSFIANSSSRTTNHWNKQFSILSRGGGIISGLGRPRQA